jgi:very-short-patch-repair endonuclease
MPAPTLTVKRARNLRRAMTPPELRLWTVLRGKALAGFHFRRQHPMGPHILDFYCPAVRLALEVDGEGRGHPEQVEHDGLRERWLIEQGVTTLRIAAIDVRDNLDGVIMAIMAAVMGEAPLP